EHVARPRGLRARGAQRPVARRARGALRRPAARARGSGGRCAMIRRPARRLAWAVFVVWATVSLAFLVTNALPSDPARMVAGMHAPPAVGATLRKERAVHSA